MPKTSFGTLKSTVLCIGFYCLLFDFRVFGLIAVCILFHELGHILAVKSKKGRIVALSMHGLNGPGIVCDYDQSSSNQVFVSMAGLAGGCIVLAIYFACDLWTTAPIVSSTVFPLSIFNLVNLCPCSRQVDGRKCVNAIMDLWRKGDRKYSVLYFSVYCSLLIFVAWLSFFSLDHLKAVNYYSGIVILCRFF